MFAPSYVGTCQLLVLVLLGMATGKLLASEPVAACSCVTPSVHLELQEVLSSAPAVDHTDYWPSMATIEGGPASFFVRGDLPRRANQIDYLHFLNDEE